MVIFHCYVSSPEGNIIFPSNSKISQTQIWYDPVVVKNCTRKCAPPAYSVHYSNQKMDGHLVSTCSKKYTVEVTISWSMFTPSLPARLQPLVSMNISVFFTTDIQRYSHLWIKIKTPQTVDVSFFRKDWFKGTLKPESPMIFMAKTHEFPIKIFPNKTKPLTSFSRHFPIIVPPFHPISRSRPMLWSRPRSWHLQVPPRFHPGIDRQGWEVAPAQFQQDTSTRAGRSCLMLNRTQPRSFNMNIMPNAKKTYIYIYNYMIL